MKRRALIFHITHVDNLPGIIAAGRLWSDAQRLRRSLVTTSIGHEHIKTRRLRRDVSVAAGGKLGDYVPFNFCYRSVMLYAIYAGAVAQYNGGQNPIVHLVSSVETAASTGRPYAFTERHAELGYAQYFDSLDDLEKVDWKVMPLTYWANEEETKEKRQAEFLVHDWFPWEGIEQIGVKTTQTKEKAETILSSAEHSPAVVLKPSWYY